MVLRTDWLIKGFFLFSLFFLHHRGQKADTINLGNLLPCPSWGGPWPQPSTQCSWSGCQTGRDIVEQCVQWTPWLFGNTESPTWSAAWGATPWKKIGRDIGHNVDVTEGYAATFFSLRTFHAHFNISTDDLQKPHPSTWLPIGYKSVVSAKSAESLSLPI